MSAAYDLGKRVAALLIKAAVGPYDALGGSSNRFSNMKVGPATNAATQARTNMQRNSGRRFGTSVATYDPATGTGGLRQMAPPAPAPRPPATGVAAASNQTGITAPTRPQPTPPPTPVMGRSVNAAPAAPQPPGASSVAQGGASLPVGAAAPQQPSAMATGAAGAGPAAGGASSSAYQLGQRAGGQPAPAFMGPRQQRPFVGPQQQQQASRQQRPFVGPQQQQQASRPAYPPTTAPSMQDLPAPQAALQGYARTMDYLSPYELPGGLGAEELYHAATNPEYGQQQLDYLKQQFTNDQGEFTLGDAFAGLQSRLPGPLSDQIDGWRGIERPPMPQTSPGPDLGVTDPWSSEGTWGQRGMSMLGMSDYDKALRAYKAQQQSGSAPLEASMGQEMMGQAKQGNHGAAQQPGQAAGRLVQHRGAARRAGRTVSPRPSPPATLPDMPSFKAGIAYELGKQAFNMQSALRAGKDYLANIPRFYTNQPIQITQPKPQAPPKPPAMPAAAQPRSPVAPRTAASAAMTR